MKNKTVKLDTNAKKFFKNWDNGTKIQEMHHRICKEIALWKPQTVFEFGCGNGKILKLLQEYESECNVSGIDIAKNAIDKGREQGLNLYVGDENMLSFYFNKEFDTIYTCSVLDHIVDIDEIMKQFQRISNHILVAETNTKTDFNRHYYPHDYESFDLTKIEGSWDSFGDGCIYEIWKSK